MSSELSIKIQPCPFILAKIVDVVSIFRLRVEYFLKPFFQTIAIGW